MIRKSVSGVWTLLLVLIGTVMQSQPVFSQEAGVVKGIVLERGTSKRIASVTVTNQRTSRSVPTDLHGQFGAIVQIGDSLIFSKMGYEPHATVIHTLSDILIDLRPSSVLLEAVTIQQKTREQEMRETMEGYRRHGIYREGKPSVMQYIFTPVTSLYERFSRTGKQARRFRNLIDHEVEASYVDRVFSRARVTALTGLDGADLENFVLIYRPAYSQAQHWAEYDIIHYIQTSMKKFEADGRPQAPRLPKLEVQNPG